MFSFNTAIEDTKISAVSLSHLGINMVVLTEHNNIDKQIDSFRTKDDKVWCGGRGKKFMHEFIKGNLLREDRYFTKNPNAANSKNERWVNFCDDCIIFVALDAVLNDNPIRLVHPSCYEDSRNNAWLDATSGRLPDLIDSISSLH